MCRLWDTFQFEGTYEWLSVGRQPEPYLEPIASTRDAGKTQARYSLFSNPFPSPQHSHHFPNLFVLSCPSRQLLSFQSYYNLDSSYSSSLVLGVLCSRVYFEFRVLGSRNGCPSSRFGCPPVLDALVQYWLLYYWPSVGHLSPVEIPKSKTKAL